MNEVQTGIFVILGIVAVIALPIGLVLSRALTRDESVTWGERDTYAPPVITQHSPTEQTVYAMNNREATKHLEWTTISGDRSVVCTRMKGHDALGRRKYRVTVENWRKQ